MSKESNKPKGRTNSSSKGGSKSDSGKTRRINESHKTGGGGGKAQSGDFGRGLTKPGGKPKK